MTGTRPIPGSAAGSGHGSNRRAHSGPDSNPGYGPGPDSSSDPGTGSKPGPGPAAGSGHCSHSRPGSGTGSNPSPGPASTSGHGSHPGSDSGTGSNPGCGPGPGSDSSRGTGPWITAAQPGPRWLDPGELDAWLNLAQVLMLLPSALDRQLREDAGIPHAYYQILATLSDSPNRSMRMTELARLTGTTTTRLSHAVANLEQRGWVRRHACPTDRRGQIANLTDAGFTVLEAAAPGHVTEVRRLIFDRLTSDDVAQLHAITEKIRPALTGDR